MLALYYRPACPFCQDVLEYADENNIEFELIDLSEGEDAINELIEKGGKKQVPYLDDTDRGEALYESQDIIAYLKTNYAEGNAKGKPRVHVTDSTCVACEG